MINKKIFAILSILVILSIGMISAKILVAGKLYNSDYSDTIADADITVWCDSNYLTTTSLADGTYAVVFSVDNCGVVNVTSDANNSNIMKVVMELPNEQEDDDDSSGSSGSSGGSYGGFYLCGNGVCDSGETANTCPEDCSVVEDEEEDFEELIQKLDIPEKDQSGFSKITGAVTGVLGSTKGIVMIVFIFGLMVIAITLISFKKRKKVLK